MRAKKWCGTLAVVAGALLTHDPRASGSASRPLEGVIDRAVQEAAPGGFNGQVLVWRGDETVFEKSYGFANLEFRVPSAPTTRYKIFSVTKTFTATAVLLLAEEGKLRLDDAVRTLLPELPAAWSTIHLRHLLEHSSGVPAGALEQAWFDAWESHGGPDDLTNLALAVKAFPAQPGAAPGTKWEYSNAGYMLLGCVVARTSGLSFRDFVQQRIFNRLGMRDSLFDSQQPIPHDTYSGSTVVPWLASGYNGTPPRIETALSKMYVEDAAGGIITTAADLRRFDEGYFRSRWLRPEVRAQMYGQPFRVSARGGYGFGWIVPSEARPRLIHSSGGTNGFVSDYAHYLDDGLSIVVLSNSGAVDVETLRGRIAIIVLAHPGQPPSSTKPPNSKFKPNS